MKYSKILLGLIISASTFSASAFDGSVDITDCPSVAIRINDLSSASGWGSHFSVSPSEDGYGGANFECHIIAGPKGENLLALCYDGVLGGKTNPSLSNRTNQFKFKLGAARDIDFVEWHVGQGGVGITAQLRSRSAYTTNRIPYVINGYFPIHPDIGVCGSDNFNGNSTLYWQANGNLANRIGREGSGYNDMTVETQ